MIDLFADLTWQIQVLVIETLISVGIALVLATRGFTRTPGYLAFCLLWNVALFALLLTGGNPSWQHFLVGAWYLLDTSLVIGRWAAGKKKEEPVSGGAAAVAATFFATVLIALLVTG